MIDWPIVLCLKCVTLKMCFIVSFSFFYFVTRANPLSAIYPTVGTPNTNSPSGIFRVTAISNGYVVDFDLPEGATRLEVYEKSSAWTVVPTDDTLMVYSGLSPATVITPNYTKRYVIVRFYDQYDNTSYYSMEKTGQTSGVEITPINVGTLSLISNPIKIQTDGSIFAGAGNSTTYPQVFFNKDGLFAYDTGGTRTTQIVNDAISGGPTFITTSAQIANWTITSNKIENTLYGVGTNKNYAGLSANGTYAFWAGSPVAGGDATSKFSVTHTGIVTMRDVHIVGNPGDGTNTSLAIGGSDESAPFRVTTSGAMTATSANITGSITVNQQSYFNANVNVAAGSYLISTGTGTVKVGAEGLLALNASAAPTTKIYSSPISVAGTSGISLWSSKALFGPNESSGWLIDSGVIKSNYITLDSANQEIKIVSSTSNSTNGILLKAGTDSDYAIQVGKLTGLTTSNAYFYVTHAGSLFASNATIAGTLRGGQKTGAADTTNAGYYFDAGGSAIIGGATTANPQAIFTGTGIILQANDERIRYTIPNRAISSADIYTYVCPGGYVWDGQTCSKYIPGVGFVYKSYISRSLTENAITDSAYSGPSKIELSPSGIFITGWPRQGDMDNQHQLWHNVWVDSGNTRGYLNVKGMGAIPRQRALVEDPVDGLAKAGFAVYYQNSAVSTGVPQYTSGLVGDLWVQY